MTEFSNSAFQVDALTIPSLSGLGSGAYSAPSSLLDNTTTNTQGKSFLRCVARLSLSAAVTAGSGSPYLVLYALAALDGTNLPNPPGTTAQAPRPNARQRIAQLTAGASFQIVDFDDPFDLEPAQYAFQVLNNSGVALGTATLTIYRADTIAG